MGQKKQKKRPQKPTAKQGQPQQHAQKSFMELVENASLTKVKPYIDQRVQQLGFQLQQEQNLSLSALARRIVVLEELVGEKLGISLDELTSRVYDLEDKDSGYEKTEEVKEGSLVRLSIATKATESEDDFAGESTLVVTGVAAEPYTLPKELETALVGLATGESTEAAFGKDGKMTAKMTVLRVSEKIQEEKADENQNAGE